MKFNIQSNPAVIPQSYTQDAKHATLRSGTVRDKAVAQQQDASQNLVLGTVRAKHSLNQDKFQPVTTATTTSTSARIRETSVVSSFKNRSSNDERYNLVENLMVNCGAMMTKLLP